MMAVGAVADDGKFQGIEVAEFVWRNHSRTIAMAALGRTPSDLLEAVNQQIGAERGRLLEILGNE